jgi:hypothetical protein
MEECIHMLDGAQAGSLRQRPLQLVILHFQQLCGLGLLPVLKFSLLLPTFVVAALSQQAIGLVVLPGVSIIFLSARLKLQLVSIQFSY